MTEIFDFSIIQKAFPADLLPGKHSEFKLTGPLTDIAWCEQPRKDKGSPFKRAGIMIDRAVFTADYKPVYGGNKTLLQDVLLPADEIEPDFYIPDENVAKWERLRKANSIPRINKTTGNAYIYNCGGMPFPDPVTSPARTIITSEGERCASRTTHIIATNDGRYRRLMPIELERLNMFPDNHTKEATNVKRGFLMGNALVIGIVEMIGRQLSGVIAA